MEEQGSFENSDRNCSFNAKPICAHLRHLRIVLRSLSADDADVRRWRNRDPLKIRTATVLSTQKPICAHLRHLRIVLRSLSADDADVRRWRNRDPLKIRTATVLSTQNLSALICVICGSSSDLYPQMTQM